MTEVFFYRPRNQALVLLISRSDAAAKGLAVGEAARTRHRLYSTLVERVTT